MPMIRAPDSRAAEFSFPVPGSVLGAPSSSNSTSSASTRNGRTRVERCWSRGLCWSVDQDGPKSVAQPPPKTCVMWRLAEGILLPHLVPGRAHDIVMAGTGPGPSCALMDAPDTGLDAGPGIPNGAVPRDPLHQLDPLGLHLLAAGVVLLVQIPGDEGVEDQDVPILKGHDGLVRVRAQGRGGSA